MVDGTEHGSGLVCARRERVGPVHLPIGVQAVDLVVHGTQAGVELPVYLAEEFVVERDLIRDRLDARVVVAQLL
jgi:hypothetical protein